MDEKEFDYMNVIPLVDVMLVLLTIVLTTSTFIASGLIPVELPKAQNSAQNNTSTEKKKFIEISQDGRIYLDSKQVSIEELVAGIKPLPKDLPVIIRADKNIHLNLFVQVLENVKKSGFTNVGLQTEDKL